MHFQELVDCAHKVEYHPIKPQVLLAGGKQSKEAAEEEVLMATDM